MVDNKSLDGFTHKQAVEALCNAPLLCRLLIERGVIPPSRHSSTSSHRSQRSDKKKVKEKQPLPPNVQRLRDESPLVAVSESPTEQVKVLEISLTSTAGDDMIDKVAADREIIVDEMQIEPELSENKRKQMIAVKQLYENFLTKGGLHVTVSETMLFNPSPAEPGYVLHLQTV